MIKNLNNILLELPQKISFNRKLEAIIIIAFQKFIIQCCLIENTINFLRKYKLVIFYNCKQFLYLTPKENNQGNSISFFTTGNSHTPRSLLGVAFSLNSVFYRVLDLLQLAVIGFYTRVCFSLLDVDDVVVSGNWALL